jgi:hypothetical protein
MNRRRQPRTKKRITCTLVSGDRRYSGVVLDCSPQGLFVQTSAKLEPRTRVQVELGIASGKQLLCLEAHVARQKLVPPQLRSVAQGGLGLQIDLPPPDYLEFYAEVTRTELPKRPKSAKPTPKLRYRVRLVQIGGPRTRVLDVQCNTLDEAEQVALESAGDGWKVIKIDPA